MLSGDALKDLLADSGVDVALFAAPTGSANGAVEHLVVPGIDATELWRRLRQVLPQSGRAPIVVAGVTDEDVREALEAAAADRHDVLARCETFDAAHWLADRYAFDDDAFDDDDDPMDDLIALAEELGIDLDDLPEIGPEPRFSLPYEVLSRRSLASVHILLLPSDRSWEAPAYLGFGGWNACPPPLEQVATLTMWWRLYGSEVFGFGPDVLELEVTRPPTHEATARTLARQQYAFCPDLVEQGFLTLERLAQSLQGSAVWSFWWD